MTQARLTQTNPPTEAATPKTSRLHMALPPVPPLVPPPPKDLHLQELAALLVSALLELDLPEVAHMDPVHLEAAPLKLVLPEAQCQAPVPPEVDPLELAPMEVASLAADRQDRAAPRNPPILKDPAQAWDHPARILQTSLVDLHQTKTLDLLTKRPTNHQRGSEVETICC